MALFGKKKKAADGAKPEDEDADAAPSAADKGKTKTSAKANAKASAGKDDEDDAPEDGEGAPPPPPAKGGILGLVATVAVVTLVAAGGGFGLGQLTSSKIQQAIAEREAAKAKPVEDHPLSIKYSGDMVLKQIEPVITNLAAPTDTWIRLETAMIFKNGTIDNPEVTAAEIRQDIVAYARTVKLAQLEGPSALQHLRDDLNERASLRTNGQVNELIIQTLVVQ